MKLTTGQTTQVDTETKKVDLHIAKSRAFYRWLNESHVPITKIAYDKRGQTTVTFVWDKDE